ncbi:MAG TPA: class I SAM-dependent methyltransferase [Candidatus Krumholzibacteria bacterium]|nr:class I SAM-dependent methyltransferase [Candidatus Krumholzibacteria bacterium]
MISFIPETIEAYADAHSTPEPALFAELAAVTRAQTTKPQMMVGHTQGLLLKFLVRIAGAKRVLEIGTFTGYSALAMAEGLPDDGSIVTCDIDPKATAIARSFWERSPHGRKITLALAPALDTIATLAGPIDFVFIDADKTNYVRYWDACVPKVRPGGVLAADNVLWSGEVLDPKTDDARALAAFNEHVLRDARVDLVMLPIRDGVTLAVKR